MALGRLGAIARRRSRSSHAAMRAAGGVLGPAVRLGF